MKQNIVTSTSLAGLFISLMLLQAGCGSFKAAPGDTASAAAATSAPEFTVNNGDPVTITIPIPAPPTPEQPAQPAPSTLTVATVNAREMQPIELQLANGFSINSNNLPFGSVYDSKAHEFLWIPTQGQAGRYQIQFAASGNRTVIVPISVTPVTAAQMAQGPSDGFKDGDVGYVFVHGAGSVDRCSDRQDLLDYWKNSPALVGRTAGPTTLACYDGRKSAEYVAKSVAEQILNANCGHFNKCIVITHSMGGLVMEHMFTHVRAAISSDPEPVLFTNATLYQNTKNKTLAVISLASAAGGSRVADIVRDPGSGTAFQAVVGQISDWFGASDDSTQSVAVQRASDILAPYGWDPGIPFYMVPGYTQKTVREQDDDFTGFLNNIIGNISLNVYQGDQSLALLENIVQPEARFDGLVDFRSACGIASDNSHAGPGYGASLAVQFQYCYNTAKKPSHYLWFASNLNHFLIPTDWSNCHNSKNPCTISDPDASKQTLTPNSSYRYLSATEAIRAKLDVNRLSNPRVMFSYQ